MEEKELQKKEKELQKDFDINSDNYEMYDELYCMKTGTIRGDDNSEKIVPMLCGCSCGVAILGFTALTYFTTSALDFSDGVIGICTLLGGIGSAVGLIFGIVALAKVIEENRFKKKYPGVNTDVDVDELGKTLEKYKELSTVPENIDLLKNEYSQDYSDKINNMTTDEKIAYFEEQKDLWKKVAIKEKYGDVVSIPNEVSKVKQKNDYRNYINFTEES